MSKKKNKQSSADLSPAAYFRTGRARKLPIYECYINYGWKEMGMANIIVSRRHVNGNISLGCFIIDTFCLGVKDAWYVFNIFESEFQEILLKFYRNASMDAIDYVSVHNIIYGAVAFAEEFEIYPHNDFSIAKMILEEDTDDIELIEYDFGVDGKPQLVVMPDDPKLSIYLRKLQKNAGDDNYSLVFIDDEEDFDEDYEHEDENYEDDEDCDEEESFEEAFNAVSEYNADKWEEIIAECGSNYFWFNRTEALYIFEKFIFDPFMAGRQPGASGKTEVSNFSINYEPLESNQTEQANREAHELYVAVHLEQPDAKRLNDVVERIKSAMKKWPDNPTFYNYLINAYALLKKKKEKEEAIFNLMETFPDYLFGRLSYAQMLIEEGRIDDVPAVFNNCFDLKSLYPQRNEFHFSEFVSFNTLMSLYYMKRGLLCDAYIYKKMLNKIEVPDLMNTGEDVMLELDLNIIKQVQELVDEAKQNVKKKEVLIAFLVN